MKTASLIMLLNDRQILLAMKKRGFGAGRWNGLGGKVEPHETIDQAVVRECQEEILVTPQQFEKVAIHNFHFPNGALDMTVHTYLCRTWQGTPTETEEMRPEWFDLDAIPYAEMWQDDILWLPLVLQGKKLQTKFTFDKNDTMLKAELDLVGGF